MKILIPLLALALFLWLCWLAWPYHNYDVGGLNRLTERVTASRGRVATPKLSPAARAALIADLWNVSEADLAKPVNSIFEPRQ